LSKGNSETQTKEVNAMEDIKEKVMKVLEALDDDSTVDMWNQYCSEVNYDDDIIYPLDEWTINDVLLRCVDGAFNVNDDWFYCNGYGNIVSTDDIFDQVDLGELADYIIDEENALGNSDIEDILEEAKEDEYED
jgi:hypothetical protein